jgi:hypothetical protein
MDLSDATRAKSWRPKVRQTERLADGLLAAQAADALEAAA